MNNKKNKTKVAAKKSAPAVHSRRKSKSIPLSGPKAAVKRTVPRVAKKLASLPTAVKKPAVERVAVERVEELPSILDSQMRVFESMCRFTPLGYFMRMQRLVREGARPHRLQFVSPFDFFDMTKAA